MSGIVLSASVRQNLLSLQSTADLLATTQNRLSTGKKVNSALDNPTNFFTAQSLDSRASDIGNLLDGIGNGVQVLQAANTGITSLQKLVDTAKSLANQALQTTVGYSTKSNVSATIAGATAADLRGTTSFSSAIASSNVLYTGAAGGTTPATSSTKLGGVSGVFTGTQVQDDTGTPVNITAATALVGATGALAASGSTPFVAGDTLTVNGKTITIKAGAAPTAGQVPAGSGLSGQVVNDGSGNSTVYLGDGTVGDVLKAVDIASGVQTATNASGTATLTTTAGQTVSSVNGSGQILLHSTTGADLAVTGKADDLKALGLTAATGTGNATVTATRTTGSTTLGALIQTNSSLFVDGHTVNFVDGAAPVAAKVPAGSGVSGNVVTDGSGNSIVYLETATSADLLTALDLASGVQTATNSGGNATITTAAGQTASSVATNGTLKISTGVNQDLAITGTGNSLVALGLAGNTGTGISFTAARGAGVGGINGKTLTFSSFNGGTPVNVTIGDGTNGTVKTLNDLNSALQADNLAATIDLKRQADHLGGQRFRLIDAGLGNGRRRHRRHADQRAQLHQRNDSGPRPDRADDPRELGEPVQQHPAADRHHGPGRVVQRRQPAQRRPAQAGVQRDREVDPQHHRRDLQSGRPRPVHPHAGRRLHRQQRDQQGPEQPQRRQHVTGFRSLDPRLEPLDRADPSGLLEEPDQRAADRFVEPDPRRYQRGSGQQPGAVDPPVDRRLGAVAGQPVAAERAAAAPLNVEIERPGGGNSARLFGLLLIGGNSVTSDRTWQPYLKPPAAR